MSDIIINPFVFASEPVYDSDAQSLFDSRQDFGDPVPTAYKEAISDYITELKAVSGLWDNITQLVITAGATTIFTSLIPVKGSFPSGINLVNGDLGIKTGIKGNGSTKYIQSGYTTVVGTSQNDFHMYGYYTEMPTTNATALFGQGGATTSGGTMILYGTGANNTSIKCRNSAADTVTGNTGVGGYGVNRNASANYQAKRASTTSTITRTSQAPPARRIHLLARTGNSDDNPANHSDARLLLWTIGGGISSLNDYDTPTSNFITALNAI